MYTVSKCQLLLKCEKFMKSSHPLSIKDIQAFKKLFKAFISTIKINILIKQGKVLNHAKTYFMAA